MRLGFAPYQQEWYELTDDMKVNLLKVTQLRLLLRSSLSAQPLLFCTLSLLVILMVFLIVLVADAICHQKLLPGVQPCPCSSCRAILYSLASYVFL